MMKLTLENFREIALGAVDVVEEHGAFCFHRFTEEQYSVYKGRDMHWYERAAMPAGIKLSFQTDSRSLHIVCNVEKILPYYTFSVDVLEEVSIWTAWIIFLRWICRICTQIQYFRWVSFQKRFH